jgi:hypothetical protein
VKMTDEIIKTENIADADVINRWRERTTVLPKSLRADLGFWDMPPERVLNAWLGKIRYEDAVSDIHGSPKEVFETADDLVAIWWKETTWYIKRPDGFLGHKLSITSLRLSFDKVSKILKIWRCN